jgi:hypothetical protein
MWSQTRFTENNTEDCDAAELSELNRRFKSRVLAEECQLHCSLNPADLTMLLCSTISLGRCSRALLPSRAPDLTGPEIREVRLRLDLAQEASVP